MRRLVAVALLLVASTGFPVMGGAASFSVAPVRLTLSADQPTAAINITANNSEKRTMQLETVAWTQQSGEDVYTPTRDLLVTPPIFELQPGETRIIRVGLRHTAPRDEEIAYRLYIREIPPPPGPGFKGVRVALRIGIPVFVEPSESVHSVLVWRAQRLANGGLHIELTNNGKAHAQIADLSLSEAGGSSLLHVAGGAVYLLPGQTRRWSIPPEAAAHLPRKQLHLITVTDQGRQQFDLAVEGR